MIVSYARFVRGHYSEGPSSTFTHDKVEYYLDGVLGEATNMPVEEIAVEALSWLLDEVPMDTHSDAVRTGKADLSAPVLITLWEAKWVVIDGLHRLAKAVRDGVLYIPAVKLDQAQLDRHKVQ